MVRVGFKWESALRAIAQKMKRQLLLVASLTVARVARCGDFCSKGWCLEPALVLSSRGDLCRNCTRVDNIKARAIGGDPNGPWR
jgi:hypothetical protein